MDEVDKIIIHSLREIGCEIDDDITSMSSFTPELVVRATAACLQQIKPNPTLPKFLPTAMAQRFSTATALAEECAACGYRSDIGYQSFLYPNTVDVRRLFMFLVEQLPKEKQAKPTDVTTSTLNAYQVLRREIKEEIQQQLRAAWVPQYCRFIGNRHHSGCSSLHVPFAPQLNLNIPNHVEPLTNEVKSYLELQAPNIFQQTSSKDYDLISTVLHRNAIDLYESTTTGQDSFKFSTLSGGVVDSKDMTTPKKQPPTEEKEQEPLESVATVTSKILTPLEKLNDNVNALKLQNDVLLTERKSQSVQINALKIQQASVRSLNEQLRRDAKVHERTRVVLENPKENVEKLEGLIQTTLERRKTLEQQWEAYRQPLLDKLAELERTKQAKNTQNVIDLRAIIVQLEQTLREKTAIHVQLAMQLKSAEMSAAPRKEYTRRILEFIGNIRKQRNDIYKVLDDTRDLQKQLNSVTAQLQRQFNYTDDLLFQSAKHDLHAKKAYKLLASLHTTCNDLVELVTQTGNITKEIRELEVQIDSERSKNIAISLGQISSDIRNFENVIKSVQVEIRKVEDETRET